MGKRFHLLQNKKNGTKTIVDNSAQLRFLNLNKLLDTTIVLYYTYNMTNNEFTKFTLTSKDVAITRQHFANDWIIKYLFEGFLESRDKKDLSHFYKRLAEVEEFLDEMVYLTYKKKSENLDKKLQEEKLDIKRDEAGNPVPF
jgi:hypothetical protein